MSGIAEKFMYNQCQCLVARSLLSAQARDEYSSGSVSRLRYDAVGTSACPKSRAVVIRIRWISRVTAWNHQHLHVQMNSKTTFFVFDDDYKVEGVLQHQYVVE